MERTVEKLEAMFQKAESDANYLSQKLDLDFENSEDIQANPVKMLQKLNDVKKEYSALVEEAASIQKAQQEAVLEFQNKISTTCQLLLQLQSKTGLQDGERPPELDELENILGIKFPSGSDDSASSQTDTTQSDSAKTVSDSQKK